MNQATAPQSDRDRPAAAVDAAAAGADRAPEGQAPDRPPAEVASFVLRFSQDLWREAGGQPRVRWRGHIRHVQGEAEARFTDFSDAVAFMQRQLAQLTLESVAQDDAAGQAQALSESFQVWEKVTEGYRELWLGAVQAAADSTQQMRRQVGQQLERSWPWWPFWPSGGGATGAPGSPGSPEPAGPTGSSDPPPSPGDPGPAGIAELLPLLQALHGQMAELSERLKAVEARLPSES